MFYGWVIVLVSFVTLAALLLGAGYFLYSRITTLWQLYVYYGVIVGTGHTALGFIPHVSLISCWFVRRRGLASGLALSGMRTWLACCLIASRRISCHSTWPSS